MRPLNELFAQLRQLDVTLWMNEGNLRYRSPQGPLEADLRAEVVARKAEIIAYLSELHRSVQVARIEAAPLTSKPFLSFSQQRLWFLEKLQGPSASLNMFFSMKLTGLLDVVSLGSALNTVAARHEALRTSFVEEDGIPYLKINDEAALSLEFVDWTGLPESQREPMALEKAGQKTIEPFDLSQGPLVRTLLQRIGQSEHLLVVSIHHIVTDGWSMNLFVDEYTQYYQSLVRGSSPVFEPLALQYRDYAHWQQGWYQEHQLKEDLAYWVQQLSGAPEMLDLPTDWQRPPEQRFEGGNAFLAMDPGLTAPLKALTQAEGATLFMTMLACFQLLLGRLAGQTDVLVGTPNANRNRTELEGLIGFFINTLVLRADLSGPSTFRQFLQAVRTTTLAAFARQDVPFEKIVEAIAPGRDLSRNSLFQVFFNMVNLSQSELRLPGLKVESLASPETPSKFDLTLYIHEAPDQIHVQAIFNATLFSQARIEEMLQQFQQLLHFAANQPDTSLLACSLVTDSARLVLPDPNLLLDNGWVGSVVEWFSREAERDPERLALISIDGEWTYGRLERRANILAFELRALGVGPEDVVVIHGHRNSAVVWAILGILKAGAAFSVFDPVYPADRLLGCLRIAQPKACVELEAAGTPDPTLLDYLETHRVSRLFEVAPSVSLDTELERVLVTVGPDHLAYLAFTSGSTGEPKAVAGRQGPLSHFLGWPKQAFGVHRDDRFSMLSGLSHDPLQRDIFTSLCNGAVLCIPEQADIIPHRLACWMRDQRITVAHLTPAMGQILNETRDEVVLPELKLVFFVGDILTRRDVARLHHLAPAVTVVNFYGTTETQRSVGHYVTPRDASPHLKQTLPAGKGIPDVQLIVFNQARGLAGVGELGEIGVRGPHLARGYLGDAELTSLRFITNPITGLPEDRVYLTGDLGRYQPNGDVEFAGRQDHQVKVRGFRIELGEIEAKLGLLEGISEAVVLAWDSAAGDKFLAAYWVAEAEAKDLTSASLRQFLKSQLPDYMVPTAYVQLEKLPITPNGKIHRKALPFPEKVASESVFEAPVTATEQTLAGLWQDLLQCERIGREDDFFVAGGHSLLAARLVSRVRDHFAVELPLRQLFSAPTLSAMAAAIDRLARSASHDTRPKLQRFENRHHGPVTFAQRRLWFVDQLQGPNGIYNMPVALRLRGRMDVEALTDTLHVLIDRHEILRSRFPSEKGQPIQIIESQLKLELGLVSLRDRKPEEREAVAQRFAEEDAARPFELTAGPVFRATLLNLAEDDHILLLNMHHIVSDAWSMGVMFRELGTLYDAFVRKVPSPLKPLPLRYLDYAIWQNTWLTEAVLSQELDWWRNNLAGVPTLLELPFARVRPKQQSGRGNRKTLVVDKQLYQGLCELSRSCDTTLFGLLMTAFNVLLYRYTGVADLLVGSGLANRNYAELEEMIGFFADTWILRTQVDGQRTFEAQMALVKHHMLDALSNQSVSFEQIVEALKVKRSLEASPLIQVMFILDNADHSPPVSIDLSDLSLSIINQNRTIAKMDLVLSLAESPNGLSGALEYNSDIYTGDQIEALLDHFHQLLRAVVDHPGQAIDDCSKFIEADLLRWEHEQRHTQRLGQLVALADLEARLMETDDVASCRALVRETTAGQSELIVYLVPQNQAPADDLDFVRLGQALCRLLPEQFVPDRLVWISQLPILPSGFVDDRYLCSLPLPLAPQLEQQLRQNPDMLDVSVLDLPRHVARHPFHLSELLLDHLDEDETSGSDQAASVMATQSAVSSVLAIAEGEPLLAALPDRLGDLLIRAANQNPLSGVRFLRPDGFYQDMTYPHLLDEARRMLSGLRQQGLVAGDCLVFQLEEHINFIPTFWACSLGGLIPVPLGVPASYDQEGSPLGILRNTLTLLEQPMVVCDSKHLKDLTRVGATRVVAVESLRSFEPAEEFWQGSSDDPALMLLTSGSTGVAKAVVQSHRALIFRSAATTQMNQFSPQDVSLNWMPLDHVGGLVMFHIHDLSAGMFQIHVAKEAILQNPLRWLEWMDSFGVTVTWAPNFAYALVNERLAGHKSRRYDLSRLRFILNGGEAVAARTARTFLQLLAPHGLAATAMFPAWGMSETCSGVTFNRAFSLGNTSDNDPFVSVGRPIPGFSVRIIDANGQVEHEGVIGRLEVKGPSVTQGYFRRPELNQEIFNPDGWFDTGDRGFLRDGQLTISGRDKDVIIINGINYMGHEIEAVVEAMEGITVSFTAACAVRERGSHTDQLALFFNTHLQDNSARVDLFKSLRETVFAKIGLTPRYLIPLDATQIPKTAIGKIQRTILAQLFHVGVFGDTLKEVDLLLENENTLPHWFFQPGWFRLEGELRRPVMGPVLFLGDHGALSQALVQHWRARGQRCVIATLGSCFEQLGPDHYSIDETQSLDYERVLAAAELPFRLVLHLGAYGPSNAQPELSLPGSTLVSLLALSKALIAKQKTPARLMIVSSGAQALCPAEQVTLDKTTLRGFAHTMAAEIAGLEVRCVDLPYWTEQALIDAADQDDHPVRLLCCEAQIADRQTDILYRRGARFIWRLNPCNFANQAKRSLPLKHQGYYVLSGGLGGVGQIVTSYLLNHFQARVLLLGRRPGETREVQELLGRLPHAGAFAYFSVDFQNESGLGDILAAQAALWGPPAGLFHLAGTYHERGLDAETPEGLAQLQESKITGSFVLERLLPNLPLWVSFSSILGSFGGRDAASYAAANSFMAQHAFARNQKGLPTWCFEWGPWSDTGMSRGFELGELFGERGYRSLSARQGLLSMQACLHQEPGVYLIGLDPDKAFIRNQVQEHTRLLNQTLAFYQAKPQAKILPGSMFDPYGIASECLMVPLESIPYTSEHLPDREALLLAVPGSRRDLRKLVPPRNETEHKIAAIWLELLPLSSISIHDSFFKLGGHSLLATQVLARIQDHFGVSPSLRDMFRTPTIAGLAERLSQLEVSTIEDIPLVAQTRGDRIPLSYAQQRLWFLNRLEGETGAYNIPSAMRLDTSLDVAIIERTITAMIERHETLRTHFREEEGEASQVIAEDVRFELSLVDCQGLTAPEQTCAALIQREGARVFDLERGPLLRVTLLRLGLQDHLLLFTMHHIISDGWSSGVLAAEFSALYVAFARNQASPLPALPIQYADFSIWQRRRASHLAQQLSYWQNQLQGMTQQLNLITDRPRPAVQSYRAATLPVSLSHELTKSLLTLTESAETTLFMTLLAGFQALLSRYAQQTDFAIGSPIANRVQRELENLIGFFVNTLVLRADLSGRPTVLELLARVKETTLSAYAHQEVPFEQVVDAVQAQRDLSHAPLFQVMLVLHNTPDQASEPRHPDAASQGREAVATKFDLTLRLNQSSAGMFGVLEYKADLFTQNTMTQFWNHFQALLHGFCAFPNQRVDELELLNHEERTFLLDTLNQERHEFDPELSVYQLFENQVASNPDGVAVIYQAGPGRTGATAKLSRRDLAQRVNHLAAVLQERGVGREDRVALAVGRSLDMIVAELAILAAGATFVPIDPSFPEGRIASIFENALPKLLLTWPDLPHAWPLSAEQILYLPLDLPASKRPTPVVVAGGNLVYIIYTSGTTGRPKGVGISHAALHNYLRAFYARISLDRDASVDTWTVMAADHGVTPVFGALCWGHPLRITPEEDVLDPDGAAHAVGVDTPGFAKVVPALLDHLLDTAQPQRFLPNKYLMMGGDASNWMSLRRARAVMPDLHLLNHYGPTETTVGCVMCELLPEWEQLSAAVPIGRPLGNYRAYILDARLRPVPFGVAGELCIGGLSLARGYWARPNLTAEKFLPDPYNPTAGSRFYRSGDLVRYLSSGQIVYLGRIDHQVKIRGYRIELEEIQHQCQSHPAVAQALVTAYTDARGDKSLAAYIVLAEPLETSVLKTFLKKNLPEYMVPAAIVLMEALPLTPLGKLDRSALPNPESSTQSQQVEAPHSFEEQALAQIWSELLGKPVLDRHADFFAMGGHSLLVTRVISRIRKQFQVDLGVRSIFETPTLAELALRLSDAPQANPLPAPKPRKPGTDLPLSFAQQRLHFLDQLEGPSPTYNLPMAIRLQGELDPTALAAALDQILCRHEVLRTIFEETEEGTFQRVQPASAHNSWLVDLVGLGVETETLARPLIERFSLKPFDLSRGPLFRILVLKLAPSEHLLCINQHHIVSDGWSLGLLVKEWVALYSAYLQNPNQEDFEAALTPLPIQYGDFALWQRDWLQGPALEQQIHYWQHQLSEPPGPLELPTRGPRPAQMSFRGTALGFELDQDLSSRLRHLATKTRTTLFMLLQTAFAEMLGRHGNTRDIWLGTPIANRRYAELEGLIGFFVNTLVLRHLRGSETVEARLARTREMTLGAFAHQDLPFERLVEVLNPVRDVSRTPLFQVMFTFQNNDYGQADLPGLTLTPLGQERTVAKFDLTLTMSDTGDQLMGNLEFNTDLFQASAIQVQIQHLRTLLQAFCTQSTMPMNQLEMLSPDERSTLLVQWNNTQFDHPLSRTLFQLFCDQVQRTPQAAALRMGLEALSYQQLLDRSLVLAQLFQNRGVGLESIIAVSATRCMDLPATLLALNALGAAYLPIDPLLPPARLAFILENSATQLWVFPAGAPTNLVAVVPIIDLVALRGRLQNKCCLEELPEVQPTNIVHIYYTSGSTGTPKGVVIPQVSLLNLVCGMQHAFPLLPGDRLLQKTPLTFDPSTWEIFATLLVGAELLMASTEAHRDPAVMAAEVQHYQITILQVVPSILGPLLDEPLFVTNTSLRVLFTGGEFLAPELMARFHGSMNAELINLYGPTETTVNSTATRCRRGEQHATIGSPLDNQTAYVLDQALQMVPMGSSGELVIGGLGLGRGYLKNPGRTADYFVPDPFSQSPGARLYKTGDLVRHRQDGDLQYQSRIGHQLKLRGVRIEPAEIEANLLQAEPVKEVSVMLYQERLVAFIILKPGYELRGPSLAAELRAFLAPSLSISMIPNIYHVLEVFPYTPSGKLDRQALKHWLSQQTEDAQEDTVLPSNHLETELLQVWAKVLTLDPLKISVTANFFDLGGHSLLAVRLLSAIKRELGLTLSLTQLFAHPTIAGLAGALSSEQSSDTWSPLMCLKAEGSGQPLYLLYPPAGNLMGYVGLIQTLEIDRPIYGFQAMGLEEGQEPIVGIEAMAQYCLQVLRAFQPQGPYHLLGWSAAGLLAYQLAWSLCESGEEVAFLGMVDSGLSSRLPDRGGEYVDPLIQLLAKELALDDSAELPLAELLRLGQSKGLIPPDYTLGQLERRLAVSRNHIKSAQIFQPKPYPQKVDLYTVTEKSSLSVLGPELGWADLIKNLQIQVMPGSHGSIMTQPLVQNLAEAISKRLNQEGHLDESSDALMGVNGIGSN